jgi:hypothetical protein
VDERIGAYADHYVALLVRLFPTGPVGITVGLDPKKATASILHRNAAASRVRSMIPSYRSS